MSRYDLHCHSTHSDGLLTPDAVVRRAALRGVEVLALTDHDDTSGLVEAQHAAIDVGIELVPGAELSVSWESHTIHVVALRIDAANATLDAGLASIRSGRDARARRIGEALADAGIPGAYEGAFKYVTSERLISRTHFARHLVDAGYVSSVGQAFERWLARGCPAFIPRGGASPADVFALVHDAGGLVSLAHPLLVQHDEWIRGFAQAGLDAIEAFHSAQSVDDTRRYLAIANALNLLVTGGSDFHGSEHGGGGPGSITLPRTEFERLQAWHAAR